jgi:hypothetical protein
MVPSAALFFGFSTFSLSGVVNVFLFWIIRRGRLLFSRPPTESSISEIELTPPGLGLMIPPDMANDTQNQQPNVAVPSDGVREESQNPTSEPEDPSNTLAPITLDDI